MGPRSARVASERDRSYRSGTALTEMALILPFLLLLFSAVIEFGMMVSCAMTLQDCARDAARWGARGKTNPQILDIVQHYTPKRNMTTVDTVITVQSTAGSQLATDDRSNGAIISIRCNGGVQWLTPLQALFGNSAYTVSGYASYMIQKP